MIIAAFLSAIADMLWGGQFKKWLDGHDRLPAIFLLFVGLLIALKDPYLAATGMLGYLTVRIAGWRFFANRELFLVMTKPLHMVYAFIHGLGFLVVPVIAYFAYGAGLIEGIKWALALSFVLAAMSFVVVNIIRKINATIDFIPFKEFAFGAIYGFAAYTYLYPFA